ncbi:XkdX family protein [Cytobacillus solani]|nr:XkdX family protein [Cytobacillus solani]USK56582.1 XkdX family protein [Cytobacillus solani]
MEYSKDFTKVKMYYDYGWASPEQVAVYVKFNKITPEEYKEITKLDYTA